MKSRVRTYQLILIAAFLLFLITLIKTAWISPRAYINFRIIENWVHGYGLGFNVGERVLPVSQPVWLLFLGSIYWFALSVLNLSDLNLLYYLTLALSIFISLLTFIWLLMTVSGGTTKAIILVMGLLISKAFIDFSTSGLENPLVHLLMLLFLLQYSRRDHSPNQWTTQDLILFSLIGFLLVALQWELFPLIGVVFFAIGIQTRVAVRSSVRWVILLLPLGSYILLATLLYGSPIPNMYVARFHAGIGWGRLARQGVMYLLNLIDYDPGSVVIISLGLLTLTFNRVRSFYPFVLGIVSTIVLIGLIGGDSVSGRLFSPLVFMSVLLLNQVDIELSELGQVAIFMGIAIGLTAARSPLRVDLSYEYLEPDHRGILDERGAAFRTTGLLWLSRDSIYPPGSDWAGDDWHFQEYQDVIFIDERALGFDAYKLGPESYVLATTGITDPLLARLPTVDTVEWDLFSLYREIPPKYEAAILEDPKEWACDGLANYYQSLRMVVSQPLFSKGRFAALLKMVTEDPLKSLIEKCQ